MYARTCCLDLDTFFVSVERLFDPSLEGRAVVVGGERGGRGVVTSASYEARAFGVRSGMSIRDATRLAPGAVFLSGHHEAYVDYSSRAREIVERYSPEVRAASIDEHYVDFRGCERLYRRATDRDDDATIERVVREITGAILAELGLPASAGIATTRSTAKVASGLAKPRGVLFVPSGAEAATLAPLGVRKLPGIGPVAEQRLHAIGIVTLGLLAEASDDVLRPVLGSASAALRAAARGEAASASNTEDQGLGRERPAFREHDPFGERAGSISNERTFAERGEGDAEAILSGLAERVSFRARSRGVVARALTLKLRYADFETLSRTIAMDATNLDVDIHRTALALYRRARTRSWPIRLLGLALSRLALDDVQLELFSRGGRRAGAIDGVRARFGYDAVHLASTRVSSKARRP